MNERIRQLAEQAAQYAVSDNSNNCYLMWKIRYTEKLTELIVRECADIAYEYDKPKLSGPGLAISSNIESHFDIYIEEDGRFVK